jgi:hypothetical protein
MHGFGLAGRSAYTAFMSYSNERVSTLKCTHTSYLLSCLIVMFFRYPVVQQRPWDTTKLEGGIRSVAPAKTITIMTMLCEP